MPDSDPSPPVPPTELEGLDPGDLLARGLKSNRPPTGSGSWVPPTPEALALLLPQYRVESLLGHGGMGAVYKGFQPTLERAVAIKLLPAEMAADEQFISRFQREARTLAKLHHPSIVAVHDFGRTSEGHLYFVMEYIDGMDLRRVLRTTGLPPEDALKVIVQICDALQAAHKQGVVHRDIKPENILLTHDGYVKLVDFGIARPMDEELSRLTMSGMIVGTPDYMSPEQRTGDVDERTDIYALGVVLYELLTGKTPRGVFPAPSRRVQIDVRIDEVVLRALQHDPEERYQKVGDMKTDVDHIRTTSTRAAEPTATATPPSSPPRQSVTQVFEKIIAQVVGRRYPTWVLGSAAVLAAVLLVLAVYRLVRTGRPAVAGSVSTENASAEKPSIDWHVPGLNDASFGGWSSFGDASFETRDGILKLSTNGGSAGIASGRNDFAGYDLHVEIAGSSDVVAWIGIRMNGDGDRWTGITSYVNGYQGQVYAGHAGLNFASEDYQGSWQSYFESGTGRLHRPVNEFFSFDFSVSTSNELTTKVNGRTTSILTKIAADEKGRVMLFVKKGSLCIRKIELRKQISPPTISVSPAATPTPIAIRSQPTPVPTVMQTPPEERDFRNSVGADMVWINPGTFQMGSPAGEEGRYDDERVHQVRLTRGYWMGRHPVTQKLYRDVMGADPSYFRRAGEDAPVECLSWYNAGDLSERITERDQRAGLLPTGYKYGLPAEAQWEYACRAGTSGAVYSVDERTPWKLVDVRAAALDPLAWYEGNAYNITKPVGQKQPNAWGLYDTLGNVWEWCADWYAEYPAGSVIDPTGPVTGSDRVLRGGSWLSGAGDCRAACRFHSAPDKGGDNTRGFRLALVPILAGPAATAAVPTAAPAPTSNRTLSVPADFPKIQAAIDAARPGDTVKVAAGDYTEQLVFKAGINLVGEDMDKVSVGCTAAQGSPLTVTACASGLISGVTFGHTTMDSPQPEVSGVRLDGSAVTLRRCRARHVKGSGISCENKDRSVVEDCDATACGRAGISVSGAGTNPTVLRNRVQGVSGHGIIFTNGADGRAEGNDCEKNGGTGIYAGGAMTNPLLLNNLLRGNQKNGIELDYGASARVEGNVSEDNRLNGIYVGRPESAITLLNNQTRGNQKDGMQLQNVANVRIEANRCEKNDHTGIAVSVRDAGTIISLRGNRCLDNKDYGLWMDNRAKLIIEGDSSLLRNLKGQYSLGGTVTAFPASNVPVPGVSSPAPDDVALDHALPETRWSKGTWVMTFKTNHVILVDEGSPPIRTWHWWTTGHDTIHIQYAAESDQLDPGIGGNLTFNPSRTQYVLQDLVRGGKGEGRRVGPVPVPNAAAARNQQ